MPRTPLRPVAAVGLVATVLAYVGCTETAPTGPPTSNVAPTGKPEAKPPAPAGPKASDLEKLPKVIAEWSKARRPPAAVVVISGEQHGYLQPCGCTDGQLGGLGRRYDLVEQIRARGWPVVPIDLGNLLHDPAGSRGGIEQEKVKFETSLKALAAMKYEAVALGAEDLKLGVFEALGLLLNARGPKFLAANAKPGEGLEATVGQSIVAHAGPVAVGVTAVLDPATYEALADPNKPLLTLQPPDAVLPAVLEKLKAESKVRVLMVEGPPEEARRLAEKFPGFDLVVSTSTFPDPDQRPETLHGGKTLLVNVGHKGKYVGVVGIFPDREPMLEYRLQPLDTRGLRQAEPMRALIDDEMQGALKAVGAVENFPRRPNGSGPVGAAYVGAEACKDCHPRTFEKWAGTKHARAYDALLNPKRNRESDAECISCHTTGFKYETGWVSAEKTPYLKGNQCENCHGPASLHVAEPDNMAYRKPMAMTADSANRSNFCIRCHDEDNDHDFTFDARYAQIFHKGLDTYDDPKVHQPRPATAANAPR